MQVPNTYNLVGYIRLDHESVDAEKGQSSRLPSRPEEPKLGLHLEQSVSAGPSQAARLPQRARLSQAGRSLRSQTRLFRTADKMAAARHISGI